MSKSNSAFAKLSLFLPWLCLLTWMPFQAAAEENSLTETFARYARHGADVWARNPSARISGEGKSCISCHTSLPYALVEPLLKDDYQAYQDMLENIDNRVVPLTSDVENTLTAVKASFEEADTLLVEAQKMISENSKLRREIVITLESMSDASRSVEELSDYLQRHPESIITGKK